MTKTNQPRTSNLHNLGEGTGLEDLGNPHRQARIEELEKQQAEINKQLHSLKTGDNTDNPFLEILKEAISQKTSPRQGQELLLEQIKTTLGNKEPEKDVNKLLLKALITNHNKTTSTEGLQHSGQTFYTSSLVKESFQWQNG